MKRLEQTIETVKQAEDFIKNLKRSDNWVSDEVLFNKLKVCEALITNAHREDLIPYLGVNFTLYYLDTGNYEMAWNYAETGRNAAEKYNNYDKLNDAISLQFRIQRYLGNFDIAQELINKQIDNAYKINNPFNLMSCYLNQATIYYRQDIKQDCLDALDKACNYALKSKDNYYTALTYNNFAGHLIEFGELERAKENLDKGYKIASEHNFVNMLALTHSNYGAYYQRVKQHAECITHLKQSVKYYNSINNINEEIQARIMLIDAYLSFDQTEKALEMLEEVLNYSEAKQQKENISNIYEQLSRVMENKGEFQKALSYYKKHKQVQEEIKSAESFKKIQNLEFQQKMDVLHIEKKNAEQMANIKHEFLANMSHEIRTPINSILGICYLLQQHSLNDLQLDYVHRLKRSGEGLLGIINDILDISKIESGKMELVLQPFSLHTLVMDICNTLEPKANEKGLTLCTSFTIKNDITLNGDSVRLYQVLLNLVSNAIKFTQKGSVKIEVVASEPINNIQQILFRISDTGIGIAKEKIERIFERYEQADATIKNTFGGTGLGLSISKKIVELMNGNIEIKSKPGKGTTFEISIPFELAINEKTIEAAQKLHPELLNGKTILIADDNEENRLVAKEILLNFNPSISILLAENGQKVLDILTSHPVDILFIDLDMPVLNGIETVQILRHKPEYNTLRIIGNTASISSLKTEELWELGFNEFIYKPYQAYTLVRNIVKQIQNLSI